MPKTKPAPAKHYTPQIVVLLVTALVLLSVAVVQAAHTQLFRLATTHQPEAFSELYFENAGKLPQHVSSLKTYTQSFVITNHEGRRTTYTYRVSLQDVRGTRYLQTVVVTLDSGARTTQHFSYRPRLAKSPLTVSVDLVTTQQTITFRTQS